MSERERQKKLLLERAKALNAKYPAYPEGLPNNEEPEDMLQFERDLIRFKPTHSEADELCFWTWKRNA